MSLFKSPPRVGGSCFSTTDSDVVNSEKNRNKNEIGTGSLSDTSSNLKGEGERQVGETT